MNMLEDSRHEKFTPSYRVRLVVTKGQVDNKGSLIRRISLQ